LAVPADTSAIRRYERCGFEPTDEIRDRGLTPEIKEMRMVQELTALRAT